MKTTTVMPCGACRQPRARAGFTLTELLVASALGAMLALSALHLFMQQRLLLKSSEIISETRQNVRTALDQVSRDVRMAGYGLFINPDDLSTWIDWAEDLSGNPVIMDTNPKIIDGGQGSDSVWIASAFEAWSATLAAPATWNDTTITLAAGEGSRFNTTTRRVIFIGKSETARITAISGDTLTISTDPTSSRGLSFSHPAGDTVDLIGIHAYQAHPQPVNQYPYLPYMTRDDCTGDSFQFYWQRMIAAGIEDVQLARVDDNVTITVTGKATVPDRIYATGEGGTKYRHLTLESTVLLRNNT